MSKGGGKQTETIQRADPWSGVQPYLLDVFGRAQNQANVGPYSGPFITPQSPYSAQSIQARASSALDPNSLVGGAQRELGRTIAGDYLTIDSNPAIQAAIDASRRTVNSQFSGDNYGSSAHQEWLARGAASAAAPFLAQERQNQLNALTLAPGLQMANIDQLAGAGAAQEARGQAEISAAQQSQQAPWQNLYNYQGLLGGGAGYGTTTTQQPYFSNWLGSAFGGGLAGYAIGGWPGAAIGAGIGLLGSR